MKGTFYTTEKLGPKQSLTPEGFLLCEEVPIARTGMMIYGPNEVPVSTGPDGIVKIFREEDQVFRPETIASAQGKPVTNDHPEEDVVPDSWKELTHGIAMNVRRGAGSLDDLLLADFLITTPEGIEAVQSGKREVSCGYEADYEETAPGVGKQSNIIINHIALVEAGRCGPRCAIGDHQPSQIKEKQMAKKTGNKVLDALMRAFKAKDAEEVKQIAEEVGDDEFEAGGAEEGGDTHIHIHNGNGEGEGGSAAGIQTEDDDLAEFKAQNEAEHTEFRQRLEALESMLAGMNGGGTGDEEGAGNEEKLQEQMLDEVPEELQEAAAKAEDSAYLAESFRDTVAQAEILAPGIKIPTFDRASKPGASFRNICGLRRSALDAAWKQNDTRGIISQIIGGKTLDTSKMTCDAVRAVFRSASAMKRTLNNSGSRTTQDQKSTTQPGVVMSIAELNRRNAERYSK